VGANRRADLKQREDDRVPMRGAGRGESDALLSADPHQAEIDEFRAAARRSPPKPPSNSSILCCQCGTGYLRGTWEQTVAAFREHEEPCFARYRERRQVETASGGGHAQ
jgi:hypothetical protein